MRAAVADRMRVLAAVPGAARRASCEALAEWLFRREAVLRGHHAAQALAQEEIQEAFAATWCACAPPPG